MDISLFILEILFHAKSEMHPQVRAFLLSQLVHVPWIDLSFEPRSEKTGLRGFRPGPT